MNDAPIKKTRKRTKKQPAEQVEAAPLNEAAPTQVEHAEAAPLNEVEHAEAEQVEQAEQPEAEAKIPKKRGRKPKGGKIIPNIFLIEPTKNIEPNIIMHLKCGEADLNKNTFNSSVNDDHVVETFQFENNKPSDLGYCLLNNNNNNNNNNVEGLNSKLYFTDQGKNSFITTPTQNAMLNALPNATPNGTLNDTDDRQLWLKIKELTVNLHTNNISDKKSACFWCTCDFDNPPILIPKFELNNVYHSYGCFCSPECATAHLFEEPIDTTTRFERYHLLNHIYCKIYNYTKNIKPAPNPYYTLNKYYGNLSIQEYRKLLKNERLLLVVDKPLSRILPELHEDNDDCLFNGSTISSSSKFKIRRKQKQTKTDILSDTFNLKQ